jgi:hypothetical protein
MILPNKFESLAQNSIVIGSYIIERLKKKPYNLENLYQALFETHKINLDQYFDALTFLCAYEIIIINDNQINLFVTNALIKL